MLRISSHPKYVRGLAAVIVLGMWPISAEAGKNGFDKFRLWNRCDPVFMWSSVNLPKGVQVTESEVSSIARSRLRAARIYADKEKVKILYPEFGVNVFGVGDVRRGMVPAATVRVSLEKILRDEAFDSESYYYTTTWMRQYVVANATSTSLISLVGRLTDQFVDEYLQANEEACGNAKVP